MTAWIAFAFADRISSIRAISSSKINYIYQKDVEISFSTENENSLCLILLVESDKVNDVKNFCILNETVEYIVSATRFNFPL